MEAKLPRNEIANEIITVIKNLELQIISLQFNNNYGEDSLAEKPPTVATIMVSL